MNISLRVLLMTGALAAVGWPAPSAWGQQAKPAAPGTQAAEQPDLSTRYRFRERYTPSPTPPEGTIGQYRVALRETDTTTVDRPRATPTRRDLTIQATYQERPAEISLLDDRQVTAAVRRYESVRIDPEPPDPPAGPKLFEGLTVWFKDRPGDVPLVLSLTPGRPLREREYLFAARQVFVPDLAFALPELPVRVGDPYRVSRAGAEALLAGTVREGTLEGKLLHIRPEAQGPSGQMMATFDITGRAVIDLGPADVHAQSRFVCAPVPAAASTARVPIMDSPGQIVRLSLAYELDTGPAPAGGEAQPARMRLRRELVLHRTTTDPGRMLAIPTVPPVPTPENSWLTYQDPKGRFRFQHPQELFPQPDPEPDLVRLIHPRRTAPDLVAIELRPQSELDLDKLRESWLAAQKADGLQTVAVSSGPLPAADWPGGWKVSRFEAALLPAAGAPPGSGRAHFVGYVLLTGRDTGLYVESYTVQDPPAPFHQQVEAMLKTFQFEGTPKPSAPDRPQSRAPDSGS